MRSGNLVIDEEARWSYQREIDGMMKPADAERITDYKTGGISLGQTRKISAVIEEQALEHDLVYVNGGQRGPQV
jgi:prolyl-tRNA editing enzyme YbaK/EbsC (Cys-tRNA(Pro) deacylase)